MAFSEKDLAAQQAQIQALEDELSRLNAQYDAQIKSLGFSENELHEALNAELLPELQKIMSEAQDKAKREGAARAAQGTPTQATGAKAPGAGRRGAVRL